MSAGRMHSGDFPGGPLVKKLLCNVGDVGWILGRGTEIPHGMEQLSPCAIARESAAHKIFSYFFLFFPYSSSCRILHKFFIAVLDCLFIYFFWIDSVDELLLIYFFTFNVIL